MQYYLLSSVPYTNNSGITTITFTFSSTINGSRHLEVCSDDCLPRKGLQRTRFLCCRLSSMCCCLHKLAWDLDITAIALYAVAQGGY